MLKELTFFMSTTSKEQKAYLTKRLNRSLCPISKKYNNLKAWNKKVQTKMYEEHIKKHKHKVKDLL